MFYISKNKNIVSALTVVGHCHCYECAYWLKNFSLWKSKLLKPDFNHRKRCHTNTLTLLCNTKERNNRAKKNSFCAYPKKTFNWVLKIVATIARKSVFYISPYPNKTEKYKSHVTILRVVYTSTKSTRHRRPKLVSLSSISCSESGFCGDGESGPAKYIPFTLHGLKWVFLLMLFSFLCNYKWCD